MLAQQRVMLAEERVMLAMRAKLSHLERVLRENNIDPDSESDVDDELWNVSFIPNDLHSTLYIRVNFVYAYHFVFKPGHSMYL